MSTNRELAKAVPVPSRDLTRSLSDVAEISEKHNASKNKLKARGSISRGAAAARHRLTSLLPHEVPKTQEDVDKMINDLDTDGDGHFSKSEVRTLVVAMIAKKKSVNRLKALVAFGFILLLGYCGVMFGIAVAASEEAKDTARHGSTLQTKTGKVVATDTVKSYASLLDFPSLPLASIRELQHVTVEVAGNPDSSFMFFKIIGFEKKNTNEVELFTERKGTSIKIHSGLSTVQVIEDGTARTVLNIASSSRRLLSASSDGSISKHAVRTMSWEELKREHNLDRLRRRLADGDTGPANLVDESFISGVCGLGQDPTEYEHEVNLPGAMGTGGAAGLGGVSDCQAASASERIAACLMSECGSRASICAGEGDWAQHYGGLGYSYPEAWTVNWMPEASTFV